MRPLAANLLVGTVNDQKMIVEIKKNQYTYFSISHFKYAYLDVYIHVEIRGHGRKGLENQSNK